MTNNTAKRALAISFTAILFLAGCFPENSLKWSADGSVGILQQDESLYLVDGQSGKLTEVTKDVSPMPDISDDGKWIAYCQRLQCDSFCKAIELLPENQALKIKNHAKWLKNEIITKGMEVKDKIPQLKRTRRGNSYGMDNNLTLEYTDEYSAWVMRYMCENADSALKEKLDADIIAEGKKLELTYYQLIVAKRNKLEDKKILATSFAPLFRAMFSPDSNHVAYLMQLPEINKEKEESFNASYRLYVASSKQDITSLHIDSDVAYGYDWRPDSKAIAYMRGELVSGNGISAGELKEVEIADSNGMLRAEKLNYSSGSYASHVQRGRTNRQVGIQFYPWAKLEYGPTGRIFFVSMSLTIPLVEYENAGLKLFSYDTLTNTVNDVLPSALSEYIRNSTPANHFSLSPDGTKVLIPLQRHKFMIYEFATSADSVTMPIPDDEGFGQDEVLKLAPAWKGNDKISCLVDEGSSFLSDPNSQRKEILILNTKGKLLKNLSKDWPKEILDD